MGCLDRSPHRICFSDHQRRFLGARVPCWHTVGLFWDGDSHRFPGQELDGFSIEFLNAPPVFPSSEEQTAPENQTAVTTVTATDPDSDPVTFSKTGGGADEAFFSITGVGVLTFDSPPHFENPRDNNTDNTYEVEIQADDGNGGITTQLVLVTVTDVNDAPVITSDGGGATAIVNAAENQTLATTVTATDEDLPAQTLKFSITGGVDQALFGLASGVLTFNAAPNFENPLDAGANNVYDVQVTVTDNVQISFRR